MSETLNVQKEAAHCAAELASMTPSPLPSPRAIRILTHLANIVSKAGIGDRRPERNFAIFLKGQEFGIPPMEALESLSASDDGKISVNASLMHAKLIESRKGRVEWLERTTERVTGRFVRNDDPQHPIDITWSMADEATDAGLTGRSTYKKYPRQMLTARVLSEGIALVFPDVATARSYTPDELGQDDEGLDELSGEFIDNTPERFKAAAGTPNTPNTASTPNASNQAKAETTPSSTQTPAVVASASASTPAPPLNRLATIQTLVQWAGLTREEWLQILKPYGVMSAKQLDPANLNKLTQSLFDRFTPFELRAAGLDLKAIAAAGFVIETDDPKASKATNPASAADRSPSPQNSSSSATEPLAA